MELYSGGMKMKYVLYDLKWDAEGNVGEQPYVMVADCGAEFDGGIIVQNHEYFGYIHGKDEAVLKAIDACSKNFSMKELSEEEAKGFFLKVVPVNSELKTDLVSMDVAAPVKYVSSVEKDLNGKLSFVSVSEKVVLSEEVLADKMF
jgi:hypothetical protein